MYTLFDFYINHSHEDSKNALHQLIIAGFAPLELLTHGLLQRGRDHSPPKACFIEQPSSWLAFKVL